VKDLIKALQIFTKYGTHDYPTHCEHDVLYICGYNHNEISKADVDELDSLGFIWSNEDDCFMSFRYGSA